jgi:hypothetical protein
MPAETHRVHITWRDPRCDTLALLNMAARQGRRFVDLNACVSKDDTAWNLHWPEGPKLNHYDWIWTGRRTRFLRREIRRPMTGEELHRNVEAWHDAGIARWRRARRGGPKPATVRQRQRQAKRRGVIPCWELKSRAFAEAEVAHRRRERLALAGLLHGTRDDAPVGSEGARDPHRRRPVRAPRPRRTEAGRPRALAAVHHTHLGRVRMTVYSYNGWPASIDAKAIGVASFVVAGVSFPGGVKAGDVATVLGHVAAQFHARVEHLVSPGCWGWSYRQNRNAANLSCHSSGTAIDCNAPKHPNGIEASHNFTRAQIAEIHRILAEIPELAEVVHWGGDWHAPLTPDPMHFEIHDHDLAKLARVAARIRRPKGEADMALLADLNEARKKHGASRLKAARVLLREARDLSGPIRATRIRAALAALRGL